MERSQFTFYSSFSNALQRIRKKADRCDAYDAIVAYALHGIEPDLSSASDVVAITFELIRPTLDTSKRKSANGKRGGKAEAKRKQTGSKTEANVKQTASEKENEVEVEKENEVEIEIEGEKENECSTYLPPLSVPPKGDHAPEKKQTASNERFDRFWAAYPRKVGKDAARKAFAKVKAPIEDILAALAKQKTCEQWTRDGGQYIPHPATWLNQGRWQDEPDNFMPAQKVKSFADIWREMAMEGTE